MVRQGVTVNGHVPGSWPPLFLLAINTSQSVGPSRFRRLRRSIWTCSWPWARRTLSLSAAPAATAGAAELICGPIKFNNSSGECFFRSMSAPLRSRLQGRRLWDSAEFYDLSPFAR